MLVHLWQNRGRFMILHLPSTSHTFCSLGRRQADNGASKIIILVLQKLTTDLEVERSILKKQGKPKYPGIAISLNLLSERNRKPGFKITFIMDFHWKAECWQDVGASKTPFGHWLFVGWGLVGGIKLFVNFFISLLLLAGIFFFFPHPLEWPGKGGGGSTEHSQLAWDTSQFIYLNNKHPACQESSDRGQFLNGMRQYVFWSAHPRRLKGFSGADSLWGNNSLCCSETSQATQQCAWCENLTNCLQMTRGKILFIFPLFPSQLCVPLLRPSFWGCHSSHQPACSWHSPSDGRRGGLYKQNNKNISRSNIKPDLLFYGKK